MTLQTDGIMVLPAAELLEPSRLNHPVELPNGRPNGFKNFLSLRRAGHPIEADPNLTGLIRDYFGSEPLLVDAATVYSFTTEQEPKQSQLWHRDPGIGKLIICFLYLQDVSAENGPFTYMMGTQPSGPMGHVKPPRVDKIAERGIRVTDSEMRLAFPDWRDRERICVGPRHTLVIADTLGFHKGPKLLSGDRLVLRLTYTMRPDIAAATHAS